MKIAHQITNLRLLAPAVPAIVKVIAFFLAWAGLWLPVAILLAIVLKWHPSQPLGNKKLSFLASLYLIVPLILWATTRIENTTFDRWGWHWQPATLTSLMLGLALGIASLAVLFCLQLTAGWIEWNNSESQMTAGEKIARPQSSILNYSTLLTLLLAFWISGTEELIFRGFLQTTLQQDYSTITSGAIGSAIFAIAHLIWEVTETLPQLPGLWLMGMVLTLARAADSGNLALAIGLHAGWIWGITTLDTAKAINPTGKVPEWITGISAKPLAGVAGIFLLLATAAILRAIALN